MCSFSKNRGLEASCSRRQSLLLTGLDLQQCPYIFSCGLLHSSGKSLAVIRRTAALIDGHVRHYEGAKFVERRKRTCFQDFRLIFATFHSGPTCWSRTARKQPALSLDMLVTRKATNPTERGKGPGSRSFPINWRFRDFPKWPYLSVCDSQDSVAPVHDNWKATLIGRHVDDKDVLKLSSDRVKGCDSDESRPIHLWRHRGYIM